MQPSSRQILLLFLLGWFESTCVLSCGSNGIAKPPQSQSSSSRDIVQNTTSAPEMTARKGVASQKVQKEGNEPSIFVPYCATCQDGSKVDICFPWPSKVIGRNSGRELHFTQCPDQGFLSEFAEISSTITFGKIVVNNKSVSCLLKLQGQSLHQVVIEIQGSDFKGIMETLCELPTGIDGLEVDLSDYDSGEVDYSLLRDGLRRFAGLKYLKIDANSWEVLVSIGHLVTVEELALSVDDEAVCDDYIHSPSEQFLLGVQRLDITGCPELVKKTKNLRMLKASGRIDLSELVAMNDLEYLFFDGELPTKTLPHASWPHLKGFILGNHIVSVEDQTRFRKHHSDALLVFQTQDIIE